MFRASILRLQRLNLEVLRLAGWLLVEVLAFNRCKKAVKMVGFSRISEDPFGSFPVSRLL